MVAEHITNLPVTGKDSGIRPYTLMLVVHSAETPLANGYAASVTNNWLNRPDVEASINAFAGPETLVRAVNTARAAWHATWANTLSVGYETTGYAAFTRAQWLTGLGRNMLDRLAREMAMDAKIYGIPLRWLTGTEVNAIARGNRSIKGLATHRQIDPVNRTDPGNGFPYDVLLATIKSYANGATSKPQGGNITTITGGLTVADINSITKQLQSIQNALADITTTKGRVSLRQFIADGTRAAQEAASNTADINTASGPQSLRVFVAQGTRAAQAAQADSAGWREVAAQLAKAQGSEIDYAKVEAAAAAGAAAALADGVDLDATVNIKNKQ